MKYVLLFVDTEQFANDLQAMGPVERERAYDRVGAWFADHADKLRGGSKLQSPETATTVRAGPRRAGNHRRVVRGGQGGGERLRRDRGL